MEMKSFSQTGTDVPTDMDSATPPDHEVVRGFDRVTRAVREATPAWIVNNGTRINFALKALADSVSIASALRPGSGSPARLAANVITLGTLIPGTIYEEKPNSEAVDAAEQHMGTMDYIGHRLKYALNPRDHVVETVGAATMLNGMLSMVSGAMQSSKRQLSWELVTGALTVVAGGALTFMHDRQRAWQSWTGIFLGRTPFKLLQSEQAWNRGYTDRDIRPGDKYQGMNLAVQLAGNVFSTFYGGVKKLPDGSIVHLGAPGEQKLAARYTNGEPQNTLTQVDSHQRAIAPAIPTMEVA